MHAVLYPTDEDSRLAGFLHQVSKLHCTLLGEATLQATEAIGRLMRAVACSASTTDLGESGDGRSGGEEDVAEHPCAWGPPDRS